jgi:hypothetical protein
VLSAGRAKHLLDAIDPARVFPRFGGNLALAQMWHLSSAPGC